MNTIEVPIGGQLTEEDLAALAESEADLAREDFTVAMEPTAAHRQAAEG